MGYCRRSKDELISNAFLWTPSHGQAKVGRPAKTAAVCILEDLPGAMVDRVERGERVREIRANRMT